MNKRPIIYIMGVSGCGKTTVGKLLALETGLPFFDGDDFHPPENVSKMASGNSLDDKDRAVWLDKLNSLSRIQEGDNGAVIACSALKDKYRRQLEQGLTEKPKWVFLEGSYEEILNRLKQRKGHYMPPSLLRSQFDALEEPSNALVLNISHSPEYLTRQIREELFL